MLDDVREEPAIAAQGDVAVLYRVARPKYVCAEGLRALWLLRREGYVVDDRHILTHEEAEDFAALTGPRQTPLAWIDGARVGDYDDLRAMLRGRGLSAWTYLPAALVFGTAILLAVAITWFTYGVAANWHTAGWIASLLMVLSAQAKLRDVEGFAATFVEYDPLARRWVGYAHINPWLEMATGLLLTGLAVTWLAAPVALGLAASGLAGYARTVVMAGRTVGCAAFGAGGRMPLGLPAVAKHLIVAVVAGVLVVRLFL